MKQIEINYLTSTGYESLYPNVNCASITDFAENLYSKSEVDEMVQELRNQTGDLKFAMGNYMGTHDYSTLNEVTDRVITGPWQVIETGFSVKMLLLFVNGLAGDYFEGYKDNGRGNLYSLPYSVTAYKQSPTNLIETRSTGFAVRNGKYRTTSTTPYIYNGINTPYYYLAFG